MKWMRRSPSMKVRKTEASTPGGTHIALILAAAVGSRRTCCSTASAFGSSSASLGSRRSHRQPGKTVRSMSVIASDRVDLRPMVTHRFKLGDIEAAYDLFGHQRDGVLKVAITP